MFALAAPRWLSRLSCPTLDFGPGRDLGFVSSSLGSGSTLTGQSLLGILSLSPSLSAPPCPLSRCALSQISVKKKKKNFALKQETQTAVFYMISLLIRLTAFC